MTTAHHNAGDRIARNAPRMRGECACGVELYPEYEYEKALCALVEKYRAAGFAHIGCANVNMMHGAVLARKRFRDMTGNNVNHCNDFSARIYRDTILAAMGLQ